MESENNHIKINIGGISRAGSDSACNDGLCNEIINLESKGLTLVPFKHTDGKFFGHNVKKMFIHNTSVQKNLIYINKYYNVYFINLNEPVIEQYPPRDDEELANSCVMTHNGSSYYNPTYIAELDEELKDKLDNDELNVYLFYNQFCFRNNDWYLFENGKYIKKEIESYDINMSFDIRPEGIAIAERVFDNLKYLQYGEDTYINQNVDENRRQVAKHQAKIANGLFNIIDDKLSIEKHINGICYLRYGVRTSNGYSYVSEPVLIASPRANTMMSLNECSYRKETLEEEKEPDSGYAVPPMVILCGVKKDSETNANTSTIPQVFSTTGGLIGIYIASLLRFCATGLYDIQFGYNTDGEGKSSYYRGYPKVTDFSYGNETKNNLLRLMITCYMKTFGYQANRAYSKPAEDTEEADATLNTSCTLHNVIKRAYSKDGFFDDLSNVKEEDKAAFLEATSPVKYRDYKSVWCPFGEYSWIITGLGDGTDNTFPTYAFMYACKEYGNLWMKINDNIDNVKTLLNRGDVVSIDVFITSPVLPYEEMIDEKGAVKDNVIEVKGVSSDGEEHTLEYWQGAQSAGSRIRKSRSTLSSELKAAQQNYYKLFSMTAETFKGKKSNDWIDVNELIDKSPAEIASSEAFQFTSNVKYRITDYKISYIYNAQLHTADGKRIIEDLSSQLKNYIRYESYSNTVSFKLLLNVVYNSREYFLECSYTGKNLVANPISFPLEVTELYLIYNNKVCKHFKKEDITYKDGLSSVVLYPESLSNEEYEDSYKLIYPSIDNSVLADVQKEGIPSNKYEPSVEIETKKNEMNVSAFADPTVTSDIYTIGTGKIIGICSNTVALSSGQFGEYPLYVFTTEGIYSCGLSDDKLKYKQILPISRDICNNANSICQVDKGVFFSSDKGLMVISGSESVCVSDVVKGEPNATESIVYNNAIENARLVDLKGNISEVDFVEYLKTCQICYLYKKNKLLITNKSKNADGTPLYDYSYMYDLQEKIFTKIAYSYDYVISDYPNDMLVKNDGEKSIVYEFPIESADENIDTMIETRAIKLGTEDIKSSYKVVLNGLFLTDKNTDNHIGIYVFGSLDCEKWTYIGGNEIKCSYETIRNIGCKVERMGVKYMRVLFVGKLRKGSKIDTISISSAKKYASKIR